MAFDVITPVKLGQAAITTGVTTLYTVPANTRTLLKEFSIANTTASAINVRVFLVQQVRLELEMLSYTMCLCQLLMPCNITVLRC